MLWHEGVLDDQRLLEGGVEGKDLLLDCVGAAGEGNGAVAGDEARPDEVGIGIVVSGRGVCAVDRAGGREEGEQRLIC